MARSATPDTLPASGFNKTSTSHGPPTLRHRHPHRGRWHHQPGRWPPRSKSHLRIRAIGDSDELNSHLGVLLAEPLPPAVRELFVTIQHDLFSLGGELAMPGYELLRDDALLRLDQALADHNATLPRLKEFILPAGTRSNALAHVCRTVARRAERSVVTLGAAEDVRRRCGTT